ncbi:hypothetical protein EOE18_10745 [Novosphingobium umbonatum]|uniref:Ribbon-helix-helix protein, CopG family n=2 Tax=Novosphingobium TaxID=165696 RepID=A0A3S2UTL6_9SPHN|nr:MULTISPECIES: hypothetical protein [Novosphingobium]NBC37256.1 hypothetical protein [Novosphingobium ovatum]OJX88333.1 MAG: hypothetical protein BGP00_06715 [Novosphingobium sp. 63-713]RVU04637.1 hypothetical protein EOE18_10745 [Novosphingobium umbonatum]
MTKLIQCGLSVSPPQYERIKRLAQQHGRRQSECIRSMIDFALPLFELGQKVDFARLITMLEFNTLALDTLVQKAAPDEADRLLDLAIEHAQTYHGA